MKQLKKLFVCLLSLVSAASFGQSTQPGFVKEYNERMQKTPLSEVNIVISNASTTASGKDGHFMLQFRTLKPGDKVNVRRIEKLGYEIFNKEALEQWFISRNKQPFTVIMCKSDRFKRIRDTYSRVSSDSYEKQLKKEEARLQAERKAGKLKEAEYEAALKKLNDEYDQQLENLDNYVDRFARIDLSELSTVEAKIIELVQNGHIEEAIRKYEQQNLEEKYKQQVSVGRKAQAGIDALTTVKIQSQISRDSLFASIKRKNEALRLAGGVENFKKIEASLKEVALSDTTNMEAVWEYAQFSYQQAAFYDAIDFFLIYIRGCQDGWKKAHAYTQMADAQRKLKRYDNCALYLEKAYHLVKDLANTNPDAYQDQLAQVLTSKSLMLYETNQLTEAEKSMLEICDIYTRMASDSIEGYVYKLSKAQNNLGNIYRRISQFDKAEQYMTLSLYNTERLYAQNPRKYLFDLASTRSNLGLIYKSTHKNDQAESCYKQAIDEMCQLMTYNPDAYREEYMKYLSNMGVLLKTMKRYEEAEVYYIKLLQQADTLYSMNQEAYAMYWGNSLLNIGNLYIKMKRFEDAKNNLLRSLPIIKSLYDKSPNVFRVSYYSVNNSLGNVCVYMKQYEEAEPYMLESLDLGEQLNNMNTKAFASEFYMVLKNLGILYMYLDNTEKAESFNLKASETAEQLYKENPEVYEEEMVSSKYVLGDFYKVNGQTEKSKKYLTEALEICKQNEERYKQRIDKINKALSELGD